VGGTTQSLSDRKASRPHQPRRATAERFRSIRTLPRSAVNCPACGLPSRRVHSRCQRKLHHLPWQGRPATIRITARRFRCLNTACARKTFAEPLVSVTKISARWTTRLGDLQRHVAFAPGGEAAARLTDRLTIPTSPDTLLRMVAAPMGSEMPPPTPTVLGWMIGPL